MVNNRWERTREHVLETCRILLATEGPATFNFTTVAARSQVARQTLYRHWGNAESLLIEVSAGAPTVSADSPGPRKATTKGVREFLRGGSG